MIRKVVGFHAVSEVMKVRPKSVKEIHFIPAEKPQPEVDALIKKAQSYGVRIQKAARGQLDQVSKSHQGILAHVAESPEINWAELKTCDYGCIFALDGLEDPQNVGSILRSGWLLGIDGVLVPKTRSVGLTPSVCKVASGGAEHIPLETHSHLMSPLQVLRDAGFWVFGLSDKSAKTLWEIEIPPRVVWVVGSEESGIRSSLDGVIDEMVYIPQIERGPSLNAGVSASIAMAETRRQWATRALPRDSKK
ncbi:MAG: RNA methyltransferase [Bdellovibrionales bacterium]|nr:RNA methyltransferase [Bdellovibrionales bacterium]